MKLINHIVEKTDLPDIFAKAATSVIEAFANNKALYAAGNGGSYCDAAHLVGELVGWYADKTRKRASLRAYHIGSETGTLTAIANDTSFDYVYARELEGKLQPEDIFIPFSTSGKSRNIVRATQLAYDRGAVIIGFLGNDGGDAAALCDYPLIVPSSDTGLIQEVHHMLYHSLCDSVEKAFMPLSD